MLVDIAIKNCRIVNAWGISQANLAINQGKIVAIAGNITSLPEAKSTIDARGKYVIPGVIDPHTHIGGYHPLEEDLKDTIGAAIGGVTTAGTFLGLGSESEKVSYTNRFDKWKETWEKNSFIDGFFHGSVISEGILNEIKLIAKRYDIASFKFFMAYKGPEGEEIGAEPADDGFLWSGFQTIASLGYPARAMIHAENIDIIYRIKPRIEMTGRQDLAAWDEARPSFCETLDIQRAIAIAELTKAPLYIVHVHAAASLDVIARAKSNGIDLIAETTPNYLLLNNESSLGPLGKIVPPLTDKISAESLWQGISKGIITCMGTDHCSVTKAMKKEMWEDALPGMPGMETFLPLMLSEGVNKGRITLEKLVEVLCYNNACVFGLYPQKGAIQIGSDADLVIIDLEKKKKLSVNKKHGLYDYIPYEGWEVKGVPVLTIIRGNVIAKDNELIAKPGAGKVIPRFNNN